MYLQETKPHLIIIWLQGVVGFRSIPPTRVESNDLFCCVPIRRPIHNLLSVNIVDGIVLNIKVHQTHLLWENDIEDRRCWHRYYLWKMQRLRWITIAIFSTFTKSLGMKFTIEIVKRSCPLRFEPWGCVLSTLTCRKCTFVFLRKTYFEHLFLLDNFFLAAQSWPRL